MWRRLASGRLSRSIPAKAGNRWWCSLTSWHPRVYPREGGEPLLSVPLVNPIGGLSPRRRGTGATLNGERSMDTVYPREGGEPVYPGRVTPVSQGPSPRRRGTWRHGDGRPSLREPVSRGRPALPVRALPRFLGAGTAGRAAIARRDAIDRAASRWCEDAPGGRPGQARERCILSHPVSSCIIVGQPLVWCAAVVYGDRHQSIQWLTAGIREARAPRFAADARFRLHRVGKTGER